MQAIANLRANKNKNGNKKEFNLKKMNSKSQINDIDKEDHLSQSLQETIQQCSDQRLRALLMYFRKNSNIENRISIKDLVNGLQEFGIKASQAILSEIVELYTDQYGIDFEHLHKLLMRIHQQSNRDSAKVRRTSMQHVKEADSSVLDRVANKFLHHSTAASSFYESFDEFKKKLFDRIEKHRSSMLSQKEIMKLIQIHNLPLYGAVLDAVFERTHHNNLINATKFVNFLDEANKLNIQNQINNKTNMMGLNDDEGAGLHRSIKEPINDKSKEAKRKVSNEDTQKPVNHGRAFANLLKSENKPEKAVVKVKENIGVTQAQIPADFYLPNETVKSNEDNFINIKLNSKDEIKIPVNHNILESINETDVPSMRSEFEWIYGYSGKDTKRNVLSASFTNEIVYSIGSFIVMYNIEKHTQRVYREHTTFVKCLCLHLNGFYVLSSSIKNQTTKGCLKLWRLDNLKTVKNLAKDFVQGTILTMALSKYVSEKLILLEQLEQAKTRVLLLDINRDMKLAQVDIDSIALIDIGLNVKDENYIVTIGKEHLAFWRYEAPHKIVKQNEPDYGRNLRPEYVTSMCFKENGDLLTGDSNGNIFIWRFEENTITQVIKHGHDGSILSIMALDNILITTGRDCKIYGWSLPRFDHAGALKIAKHEGGIKYLVIHKDQFIISTKANSILCAKRNSTDLNFPLNNAAFTPESITESHLSTITIFKSILNDQINAKDDEYVITCGLDGFICILKPIDHKVIFKYQLNKKYSGIVSIEFSKFLQFGPYVLIGTNNGNIIMFSLNIDDKNLVEISKLTIKNKKITDLQLSPDETMLAAATAPHGIIYIVKIYKDYKTDKYELALNGSFKEHSTDICGLDWSEESINGKDFYIRSSSLNDKKSFTWSTYDYAICNQNDIKWHTANSLFTFENLGILQLLYEHQQNDIHHHNGVDSDELLKFNYTKSQNYSLININSNLILYLFNYPTSLKSKYFKFNPFVQQQQQQQQINNNDVGHNEGQQQLNINCLKFNELKKYLLIADATFSCIMQFKLDF